MIYCHKIVTKSLREFYEHLYFSKKIGFAHLSLSHLEERKAMINLFP